MQYWPSSGEEDNDVKTNGNNIGPVAAVITRVWSAGVCNLTVFPDFGPPALKGSVSFNTPQPTVGIMARTFTLIPDEESK